MKKGLTLVLASFLLFTLIGCSASKSNQQMTNQQSHEQMTDQQMKDHK